MLTGKEKASDAIKINKRIMMGILKKDTNIVQKISGCYDPDFLLQNNVT